MDGPIDMERKGREFMGSCTHYVTLNYDAVLQSQILN